MKKKNNNKNKVKMIVDILMLILMVVEYSRIITGSLIHEILGISLFILFIIHNYLNIWFYRTLFKEKYNAKRIVSTIVNLSFLLCMLLTIILGIPISEKVFSSLNLNGNMTMRKLHTIFGYWSLVLLGIHLGLHFKMIFRNMDRKIDNLRISRIINIFKFIICIYGIKAIIDTKFFLYLIGKSSFAIPTNIVISLINTFSIIFLIGMITYKIEDRIENRELYKVLYD